METETVKPKSRKSKTTNVYDVLAEVQARIGGLSKDAVNPHFKKQYLSLDGLLAVAGPAVEDAGAVFWWSIDGNADALVVSLHFRAMGGADEEIVSSMTICESSPQKVGAALTYYKRYTLGSLLRVRMEEDDDGNAAQARHDNRGTKPSSTKANNKERVNF